MRRRRRGGGRGGGFVGIEGGYVGWGWRNGEGGLD